MYLSIYKASFLWLLLGFYWFFPSNAIALPLWRAFLLFLFSGVASRSTESATVRYTVRCGHRRSRDALSEMKCKGRA